LWLLINPRGVAVEDFEWDTLRFSAKEVIEELLFALSSTTSVHHSGATQKREICEFPFFNSLLNFKSLIMAFILLICSHSAHSVPLLRSTR
jgi:hypothetical protein